MAEFLAGPTMVLQWIWSGGTVSLAADYRTCNWAPTIAYVDVSAGGDTQIGRLTALKDATASIELVGQTGGTAIAAALSAGVAGTLIIGPEGTATGKRKITFPSYSDGAVVDFPYADVVAITCGFTGAGSLLSNFTDGVY
jgi:hypothetical protein